MRPKAAQRGFGLVAALFVIVIIAGVIAAMARMAVTQNATNSMGIQQARAYQAARAGLEYGIAQVLASPNCAFDPSLPLDDGFTVVLSCSSSGPSPVLDEEGVGKTVTFYTLEATAEYGSAGNPDYAYRQLTAVVER